MVVENLFQSDVVNGAWGVWFETIILAVANVKSEKQTTTACRLLLWNRNGGAKRPVEEALRVECSFVAIASNQTEIQYD